jgi:hypothetical protein
MKTRGKILREPGQGPGIVMIEGQQFRFQLEGVWQSATAPRPGLVVEVDLDRELQVVCMWPVAELQLAHERPQTAVLNSRHSSRYRILDRLYARLFGRDGRNQNPREL